MLHKRSTQHVDDVITRTDGLTVDDDVQRCLCHHLAVMPELYVIEPVKREEDSIEHNRCSEIINLGDSRLHRWSTGGCEIDQSDLSLLEINWRLYGEEDSQ